MNVLSNAYKYSPAGGPVTVELLAAADEPAMAGIRIVDRGIGMSPEQLARVIHEGIARGGPIVVPAFAIGRTQELMYVLAGLEQADDKAAIVIEVVVSVLIYVGRARVLHQVVLDAYADRQQ